MTDTQLSLLAHPTLRMARVFVLGAGLTFGFAACGSSPDPAPENEAADETPAEGTASGVGSKAATPEQAGGVGSKAATPEQAGGVGSKAATPEQAGGVGSKK